MRKTRRHCEHGETYASSRASGEIFTPEIRIPARREAPRARDRSRRSTVRRDSCHLYVTKPACLHRARQVQRGGRWCLRGARAIRKGLSEAAPLTPAHTTRIGAAAPSCVEPHFSAPPRFRTFQICPKDLPVTLQQVERTADRSTTAPRRRKADVRHGRRRFPLDLDHDAIVALQKHCRVLFAELAEA